MEKMKMLETAIKAALKAGEKIMQVYSQKFQVDYKGDYSPLTEADIVSNETIISYLSDLGIPIISEENKQVDYSVRKNWDLCWIIDPLDGTKEFVNKNGEFTVNIALVKQGKPIMGIIYVPYFKHLYYTDTNKEKAYKTTDITIHNFEKKLFKEADKMIRSKKSKNSIRVVGSRSHMNDDTNMFIEELKTKYLNIDIISKGSSLKFCLVAEGAADIYPRFGPTMEWDTAAGQALCEAVGLRVIDVKTNKTMVYNRKELLNNHFLVKNV